MDIHRLTHNTPIERLRRALAQLPDTPTPADINKLALAATALLDAATNVVRHCLNTMHDHPNLRSNTLRRIVHILAGPIQDGSQPQAS